MILDITSKMSGASEEQFIDSLVNFYRSRGAQYSKAEHFVARINGKQVIFSDLFALIQEFGGSSKVTSSNSWDIIFSKLFKTNEIGTNFAAGLRQIYNRYLYQFEKSLSNDTRNNAREDLWNNDDEEDENLYSRVSSLTHPHHYTERKDYSSILNERTNQVHDHNKIYNSMLSTLPNEMSFALNVSTLLSNDNQLDWHSDYKFVNCLLNMMKSYVCVCDLEQELLDFGHTEFGDDFEVKRIYLFYQVQLGLITPEQIRNALNNKSNNAKITEVKVEENENCEETVLTEESNPYLKRKVKIIERRCNCFKQLCDKLCHEDAIELIFKNENTDYDTELPFVKYSIGDALIRRMRNRLKRLADLLLHISATFDMNAEDKGKPQLLLLIKFLVLLLRSKDDELYATGMEIMSNLGGLFSFSNIETLDGYFKDLLSCLLKSCVDCFFNNTDDELACYGIDALLNYLASENSEANYFLESQLNTEQMISSLTRRFVNTNDVFLTHRMLDYCLIVSETRSVWFARHDLRHLTEIFVNLLNCEEAKRFSQSSLLALRVEDYRNRNIVAQMLTQQKESQVALLSELYTLQFLTHNFMEEAGFSINLDNIHKEYCNYAQNSGKVPISIHDFQSMLKRLYPKIKIHPTKLVEGLRLKNVQVVQTSALQKPGQVQASPKNSAIPSILKAQLSAPPKLDGSPVPVQQQQQQPVPTTTVSIVQPQLNTNIKDLLLNKIKNNANQAITVNQSGQPIANAQPRPTLVQTNQPQIVQVSQSGTTLAPNTVPNNAVFIGNHGSPGQIFLLRSGPQGSNSQVRLIIPNLNTVQNNRLVIAQQPNGGIQFIQQAQPQNSAVVSTAQINQVQRAPVSQIVPKPGTVSLQMIPQRPPTVSIMPQQNQLQTQQGQTVQIVQANSGTTIVQQQPQSLQPQQQQQPQQPIQQNNVVVVNSQPNSQQSQQQIQPTSLQQQTQVIQQKLPQTIRVVQPDGKIVHMIQQPIDSSAPNQNDRPNPPTFTNSVVHHATPIPKQVSSSPLLNVLLDKGKLPEETFSSGKVDKPLVNGVCNLNDSHPKDSNQKRSIDENHVMDGEAKKIKVDVRQNSCDSLQDAKQRITPIVQTIPTSFPNSTLTQVLQAPTLAQQVPQQNIVRIDPSLKFECEWHLCNSKYAKPQQLWYHIYNDHIHSDPSPVGTCMWGGADGKGPGCRLRRPKYSLLTHVHENHGNIELLKQQAKRKEDLLLTGISSIPPPPTPLEHPGYPQDAAMNSIKRHYIDNLIHPATGCVSTSIRLTSALIIRNLTHKIPSFKKTLGLFEKALVEIAYSDREESRTIAQVLCELSRR